MKKIKPLTPRPRIMYENSLERYHARLKTIKNKNGYHNEIFALKTLISITSILLDSDSAANPADPEIAEMVPTRPHKFKNSNALVIHKWIIETELDPNAGNCLDVLSEAKDYYTEMFYVKNDPGHQVDHMDAVFERMLKINEDLELSLDPAIMFMCAYLHDAFVWEDRAHHQLLARDYVLDSPDQFLATFSDDDRKLIAAAVFEHRASGANHHSNEYSRVLSIADKDEPSISDVVIRGFKCSKPLDDLRDRCTLVLEHVTAKFSRSGYGFKSKDYRDYYKDQLEDFWDAIDMLTVDNVMYYVVDMRRV